MEEQRRRELQAKHKEERRELRAKHKEERRKLQAKHEEEYQKALYDDDYISICDICLSVSLFLYTFLSTVCLHNYVYLF